MSELQSKRTERSLLLQRLQEIRHEINDEKRIDLNEKWDKLQNIPLEKIKLYNIYDNIDTSIFNPDEDEMWCGV